MNKKLQEAEIALDKFLSDMPNGVTMKEILRRFRGEIDEAELRAAVWTLKARGTADFEGGKLIRHALAA